MLNDSYLAARPIRRRLIVSAIAISGIVIGFSSTGVGARSSQEAPGLYRMTGWSVGGNSYQYAWVPGAAENVAYGIDVNGELGHPLYVSAPTGHCTATDFTATKGIRSGRFPGGVSMDSNGAITGIPTERGHFIVTLALSELTCNGSTYTGFRQELRFHITGSGQVVQ